MFARSSKTRIGHSRPSFTLVELLVSIAIIGVMAGMVLYTLAGAQQDALRTRTRGTIDKINQVILERWEGYRYRSVKLAEAAPPYEYALRNKLVRPRGVAKLRSLFLKDMMRMEMPDDWQDLAYTPTDLLLANAPEVLLNIPGPVNFKSSPGREYNVLRNYFGMGSILNTATAATAIPNSRPAWAMANQEAECLYAIVAHSTSGGGSGLEAFVASEIGDVDGDGFPEFIDAWGTPIRWIRWPAGYTSALNESYKSSPDAFDPLRTAFQWRLAPSPLQMPWTLVPLVISAGADRRFGIEQLDGNLMSTNPFATTRNVFFPSTDAPAAGKIFSLDQASDNVTNHDLLIE